MPRRRLEFVLMLGAFLTLRGYHSREVDQAYRLPLLLHHRSAELFAADPFVRAFDEFNPHVGYIALLDGASRVVGLSGALALLFLATFVLTARGADRLARSSHPGRGTSVGLLAVASILIARAGNLGTNHLFEGELLDRLLALGLGWTAYATLVEGRGRFLVAAALFGCASLIHPSLGIQLTSVAGASIVAWRLVEGRNGGSRLAAIGRAAGLMVVLVPVAVWSIRNAPILMEGLDPGEFRLLSVEIQGPQHMRPALWRADQWLAGAGYLVLALLGFLEPSRTRERTRIATTLALIVAGLGVSTVLIEVVGDLRMTLFQPYRLATWARGLALVLGSGRILRLWAEAGRLGKLRAALLMVGLAGDRMFVLAIGFDLAATLGEWAARRTIDRWGVGFERFAGVGEPDSGSPSLGSRRAGLYERLHAPDAASRGPRRSTRSGFTSEFGERRPSGSALRAMVARKSARAVLHRILERRAVSTSVQERQSEVSRWSWIVGGCVLVVGWVHLLKHDTESGHVPLAAAALAVVALDACGIAERRVGWTPRRMRWAFTICWSVPIAACVVPPIVGVESGHPAATVLAERCRFWPVPLDDVEKLAVWARDWTPNDAVFIGPPGPKAFRLWSLRSVVFNRAAGPYHARGLADWARRFREHVGFEGTTEEFSRAYLAGRHALEAGYTRKTNAELASLARSEGATHVLADAGRSDDSDLEPLHAVGRYAIYRVR
ncbi:MAG: DUF6798 domain-containing protein [Isosphaeraceae bacterium]|nr:DUF6798 domain-containing protein [Isosphaeraceae bacterium]